MRFSLAIAFCFVFAVCGCSKSDHTLPGVDLEHGATVRGTVTVTGTSPADACVDGSSDKACHCTSVTAQHWVVRDGKVANAFIYIKDGLGNTIYQAPEEPVVLDQKDCIYKPHVMGVMVGQTLQILNSDATLHNVHLTSMTPSLCFNRLFPQGMAPMDEKMTTPEVMKTIRCDVHGWMNCYVGVVSNPFFSVSDSTGQFEIRGIPPGTYTLELWHESSTGSENAIVESRKITVKEKESQQVDFAIEPR